MPGALFPSRPDTQCTHCQSTSPNSTAARHSTAQARIRCLRLRLRRCARLRDRKWLWVKICADVLCVAIILSTLLLKQHSVIDAAAGVVLAVVLDAAADGVARRTAPDLAYRRRPVFQH